jgi:hypothetical protein
LQFTIHFIIIIILLHAKNNKYKMAPGFWDKFTGFFKKVGSGIKKVATKTFDIAKKVVKKGAEIGAKALKYVKPALKVGLGALGAKYGLDPNITSSDLDMGEGVLQAVGDVKPDEDPGEEEYGEEEEAAPSEPISMTEALKRNAMLRKQR